MQSAMRLKSLGFSLLRIVFCLWLASMIFFFSKSFAQEEGGFVQGKPVSTEVYKAALLVNEGLELIRANRNEEAIEKLNQAIKLAPNLPEAHHNLGLALAKLGKLNEAVAEMQLVVKFKPDIWSTWLTLGGLYQSTGQIEDALSVYREFLSRFPDNSESGKVLNLVKGLNAELKSRGDVSRPSIEQANGAKDYLGDVTRQGVLRWPARRMPIKVFIKPGDNVAGYSPNYFEILKKSFQTWESSSTGLVQFLFVNETSKADIDCSWTNNPHHLANAAEAGEARLLKDKDGIVKATIVLLTSPLSPDLPLTNNRVEVNCLHEVGHALGMAGHTTNPGDIMFYSGSMVDKPKTLSERDCNTLVRLYSMK